jgi:hypothetical protein
MKRAGLSFLFLWLDGLALVATGQEIRQGTIENLNQDNGSLTISGQVLPYSDAVTQVFLEERQISASRIDLGMVVRYTLDASGTLWRIELIGPHDKLMELQQH